MLFYNKKIWNRCFDYRGRRWYKNITQIPLYFRLMHHLIKYGYDEYATWETYSWFMTTMKSILTQLRNNHYGYPVVSLDDEELQVKSEIEYDKCLDKMITLLNEMDEDNPKYNHMDYKEKDNCMEKAKDEFFKLFSKYFYFLWD